MPFALIIAGLVHLITAVRGTTNELGQLVKGDFTGPNNFIYWFISIIIVGAVGYVPRLKPLSNGFLVLIVLVLFLKRGAGFFDSFQSQIGSTQNTVTSATPKLPSLDGIISV